MAAGRTIGENYPAIIFQLVIAYVLYWIGKQIVRRTSKSLPEKDSERKRSVYILSGLGLLGLLSPIIGFFFALPSYLIAQELITPENKNKKKLVYISGTILAICLLNAAAGAIIFSK